MKDTNIKKLVIELAKAQIQTYEMLSSLKAAHGTVADPFLRHPLDVSPGDSAMILEHLNFVAAEFDKLSDSVEQLKSLLAALE